MNISKGGVSFSIGKQGYTLNFGKYGVKQTVGIPGSGISHTSYLGKDDDNGDPDQRDDKREETDLPEMAMMAMAAEALDPAKNDEKEFRRGRDDEKDQPRPRTRRKSSRRRTGRQRRNSSRVMSFVFLGALVFFCVGAAVLGLIPSDFVNNLGHVMVEWAQRFGR